MARVAFNTFACKSDLRHNLPEAAEGGPMPVLPRSKSSKTRKRKFELPCSCATCSCKHQVAAEVTRHMLSTPQC